MSFTQEVAEAQHRLKVNATAQRRHAIAEAKKGWQPPALVGSLHAQLRAPREKDAHVIDTMLGEDHNLVIAAQYKTGKTTMGLNLVRALVDGVDFLDHKTNMPDDARVCWMNGEMTQNNFLDYVAPMGVQAADRVAVLHLRGARLPILDDYVARWVIRYLRANKARVWVVDSWRRLCTWSGVNENHNEEVDSLTDRIDWIKQESGCREFITLAHTGRAKAEEGEEHSRGATSLDDWADVRWVLTSKQGARFMYTRGRAGDVPEFRLDYDPDTRLLTAEEGNRSEVADVAPRIDKWARKFADVVRQSPGLNTQQALDATGISSKDDRSRVPKWAEDGLDLVFKTKRGRAWLWYPVGDVGDREEM